MQFLKKSLKEILEKPSHKFLDAFLDESHRKTPRENFYNFPGENSFRFFWKHISRNTCTNFPSIPWKRFWKNFLNKFLKKKTCGLISKYVSWQVSGGTLVADPRKTPEIILVISSEGTHGIIFKKYKGRYVF